MDALHLAGIRFAQVLQSGPPWLEKFWLFITSQADPKSIFTVCFPLAYFLDPKVGVAVLWTGLVAEWLNVVLKWFLFGERPFWWIHESGLARQELLGLRQFPQSCETGPGSPSGHCMIPGAALWPLVTALSRMAARHSQSKVLQLSPFLAYFLLLLALALSRIFVLAHFPHQVLGGILTGAALGWGLQGHLPLARSPRFFVATSVALLVVATGLWGVATAAGIDIDWSLHLASRHCSDPSWLRPDTRPFSSLCRDSGSALGLGLAARFPPPRRDPPSVRSRVVGAVLGLGVLGGLQGLPQPGPLPLWYLSCFLRFTLGPWIVTALLPRVLHPRTPPTHRH